MRKIASRSMFWLAIAILVENVARIAVDSGVLFLTPLILIWIANAIARGSTTACRWAIFFMGLYTAIGSFGVYLLNTELPGAGQIVPLPIDVAVSVLLSAWSAANLVLVARVRELENMVQRICALYPESVIEGTQIRAEIGLSTSRRIRP